MDDISLFVEENTEAEIIDEEGRSDRNKNTSKFISLILRHKPETIGITLDEHGWADVRELIDGINRKAIHLTYSEAP